MIFLSYAGSDADSARALASGLKTAGLDVWCDSARQAIEAGAPVIAQLESKVRESTAFLLLVGKRGVDRWVRVEVEMALVRQVREPSYRLVPLLLPGMTVDRLPPFLARLHAVFLEGDVTRWGGKEFLELAGQFQAFTARLPVDPKASPFPGLESFGHREARFFFGRERELFEALAKLGREKGVYRRWLSVEGASGSGKSSFVKAGLVPAIRKGGWVQGAPRHWRVATMRPGRNPIHQLARALVRTFRWQDEPGQLTRVEAALRQATGLRDLIAQKTEEKRGFLLVLDQLEELFTLAEDPREQSRLESLLMAALEGDSPLHLVTTIRGDFLGHINKLPLLTKALNARWTSRYMLGPLEPEGLRAAILAPAQMAGLSWQDGLPERILQDAREGTRTAGESLPLVAHVLRELWKRRSEQVLTHAAYDELGGVGGALTHSADELLATFTEEEQALVRELMLSLVKVSRGEQDVRRTRTLEEAIRTAGGGKKGLGILTRLSGGRAFDAPLGSPAPPRLLSVDGKRVDLVHEALLKQWQTLKSWLEKRRKALERQDDLEAAAKLWKATGALPGEAQFEYLKSAEPGNSLAQEFLEAARRVALARELVTRTGKYPVRDEPQLSLRLLLEAWRLDPGERTANALLAWFRQKQRLRLSGHSGSVYEARFNPDGRHILTASEDGTARLWEAASGQSLVEFRGHSGPVYSARFSPDGRRVLTASRDNTARLWEAASGQSLAVLRGHSSSVYKVRFSPDGRHVLTASEDGTARLWEAASGQSLAVFRGHSSSVSEARLSPDGRHVLTASQDGTARLWEATSGQSLAVFRGHSGWLYEACFSPDGRHVLTASQDGTARLWEAASGQSLVEFRGHSDTVGRACFSPDGRHVLTASVDKTARLWEAASGQSLAELRGHSDTVYEARFSADGRHVLTASQDGTARQWEAASGQSLAEFRGHSDEVYEARFSPDGRHVLTASQDGTARLWEAASGQSLAEFRGHSDTVYAARFSADGHHVLTASDDHTACLWEAASGQSLTVFRGHSDTVYAARFSPDGRHVLTASFDKTARLWEAASGQSLVEFRAHSDEVYEARFSPDGRHILTASVDKTARLWEAASGQSLTVFRGHSDAVYAARFSADGRHVLTASDDNTARLWEATSGQVLVEFRGHSDTVYTARFSPDGRHVLTASDDKTARLWEAASGQSLAELRGHSGAVYAARFSPDGRHVLTASADKTARLWEATSGQSLAEFRGHSGAVYAARFSPDGRHVLTASDDKTACLWEAASGQLLAELRGHSAWVREARFSPDGRHVLTASADGTARLWWVHELCAPIEELVELARTMARELSAEERRLYLHEEAPPSTARASPAPEYEPPTVLH